MCLRLCAYVRVCMWEPFPPSRRYLWRCVSSRVLNVCYVAATLFAEVRVIVPLLFG